MAAAVVHALGRLLRQPDYRSSGWQNTVIGACEVRNRDWMSAPPLAAAVDECTMRNEARVLTDLRAAVALRGATADSAAEGVCAFAAPSEGVRAALLGLVATVGQGAHAPRHRAPWRRRAWFGCQARWPGQA